MNKGKILAIVAIANLLSCFTQHLDVLKESGFYYFHFICPTYMQCFPQNIQTSLTDRILSLACILNYIERGMGQNKTERFN